MANPVLDEFQFDLDGYIFGRGLPVFIDSEGFDPGDPDLITQDGVNPQTGARVFGRDMHGAGSWTFACHVDREDVAGALGSAAAMGAKWRDEKWLEPDAIAILRYRLGGRTRCVFGRPRRFSFRPGNAILGGTVPPLASFDLVDSKHYDDAEQFVELRLRPSSSGGFVAPLTFPLVIETPADAQIPGEVKVAGDTSTAAVVDFYGPVTDPSVTIGDFVVALVGTIPAGASVTVDSRPWSQGMFRTGNTAGVRLGRETRLTKARLRPGTYSAVFRGGDLTGGARCRVRWRNANTTL